jgi:hypothetical protein
MRVTDEGMRAGAQRIAAKAQEVGGPTVVERRELEEEQPDLFEMGAALRGFETSAAYGQLVHGAAARSIVCTLSKAQYDSVITAGHCFYCGQRSDKLGVDRVAAGARTWYELRNSVACCWDCNRMKGPWDVGTSVRKVAAISAALEQNRADLQQVARAAGGVEYKVGRQRWVGK